MIQTKNKKVLQSLILLAFLSSLILGVVSFSVAANPIEPEWVCPSCTIVRYDYECNYSRCASNPTDKHGVVAIWRCVDCDGTIKYEDEFKYCVNFC